MMMMLEFQKEVIFPQNRLRGFERNKVGPKDGDDFVGGNYVSALNFRQQIYHFIKLQLKILIFHILLMLLMFGVLIMSSIDDSNVIRSSTELALDFFNTNWSNKFFICSNQLQKLHTDKTETFRFNLGTTF